MSDECEGKLALAVMLHGHLYFNETVTPVVHQFLQNPPIQLFIEREKNPQKAHLIHNNAVPLSGFVYAYR